MRRGSILLLVLAGCASNPWKDAPKLWVPGKDPQAALAAVQDVFTSQGQRVETVGAEAGEVATQWDVVPAVFRQTATRTRLRVQAEPGERGTWLRIRCEREGDRGRGDPLDPGSLRWKEIGYDPDMEARYLFLIQRRLSR